MGVTYKLTVFEPTGEKLLDESFTAENDEQAKKLGEKIVKAQNYENKTYRCISPLGKLLLFHR
jgi:hypothetical protein